MLFIKDCLREVQVMSDENMKTNMNPNDGQSVGVNNDSMSSNDGINNGIQPTMDNDSKPKGKKGVVIGIVAAVILVACGTIFFLLFAGGNYTETKAREQNVILSVLCDNDGVGYVPLMNGDVVKIDDNVFSGALSPDRKRIIYLTKGKELYLMNSDKTDKKLISDKTVRIVDFNNFACVYSESGEEYCYYTFAGNESVSIGRVDDYKLSKNNANLVFAIDGGVYEIIGTGEKEKLGNYKDTCEILLISDDGKTVFWNDGTSYEHEIYVYTNGEKSKVGTINPSDKYGTYGKFNSNQTYAVISNLSAEELYVVNKNEEPIKIKIGNKLDSSSFYTAKGDIRYDSSSKFPGMYFAVSSDSGINLYFVDERGEKEKVMAGISSYIIQDGFIYYIDEDDNLRKAKLSGATMTNDEKITGDVGEIYDESHNGIIYFLKDISSNDQTGILYAYKQGDEPTKIATDVALWEVYGYIMTYGSISTDGRTIYYFKDVEDIGDTYSDKGVLYRYTYGDKESEKITDDVVVYSVDSGYFSGNIDTKSFVYQKYSSGKTRDNLLFDIYYYDGKESKVLASDIKKN